MADVQTVLIGSMGDVNVGAAAAIALLNPLAAQLDLAIAYFLGPLQLELELALKLAIDLQVSLSLGISLSLAAQLDLAVSLVASLSAAIAAGAGVGLGISFAAEVGVAVELGIALGIRIGLLNVLLEAMLAIKIPAMRAAAEFAAALSGPDVAILIWNGTNPGDPLTLSQAGASIKTKFDAGLSLGPITGPQPGDNTLGVVIVGSAPSLGASFGLMFADPTGLIFP